MARGTAYLKEWEMWFVARRMDVQTTSTCDLCGWTTSGWLATVTEAFTQHRLDEHPELQPPKRKRRVRPGGQVNTAKNLDDNIAAAREQGAAGWSGHDQ